MRLSRRRESLKTSTASSPLLSGHEQRPGASYTARSVAHEAFRGNVSGPRFQFPTHNSSFHILGQVKLKLTLCQVSRTHATKGALFRDEDARQVSASATSGIVVMKIRLAFRTCDSSDFYVYYEFYDDDDEHEDTA